MHSLISRESLNVFNFPKKEVKLGKESLNYNAQVTQAVREQFAKFLRACAA